MLWRSVAGHALANLATDLYSTKNVIFLHPLSDYIFLRSNTIFIKSR